MCFSGKLKL